MTINRQAVSGKIVHEEGFLVQVATESPETNNAIKMEVGCLWRWLGARNWSTSGSK